VTTATSSIRASPSAAPTQAPGDPRERFPSSGVVLLRPAIAWLARSQRADGSWRTRSIDSDSARAHGCMADAATAYATLALTTCPE
jgi:hypothetical protein